MPTHVVNDVPQKRICGAKRSDGSGRICQSPFVMANGRCRDHGGETPVGLDRPATALKAGGRYSKHIPTRLAAKYVESAQDPDLIALRDELALVDTRIADLLEQVSNSEAGELWKRCRDAMREYDRAAVPEEKQEALSTLRFLIREGYQEYMAWIEIRETIEQRRKLADTERQRLKDLQATIDARSAMLLVQNIVRIIRENVDDKETTRRISREIGRLTGSDKARDNG